MLFDLSGVRGDLSHLLGFKEGVWLVHLLGQWDHGVGWEVGV
jgi:hypothetical protein